MKKTHFGRLNSRLRSSPCMAAELGAYKWARAVWLGVDLIWSKLLLPCQEAADPLEGISHCWSPERSGNCTQRPTYHGHRGSQGCCCLRRAPWGFAPGRPDGAGGLGATRSHCCCPAAGSLPGVAAVSTWVLRDQCLMLGVFCEPCAAACRALPGWVCWQEPCLRLGRESCSSS